MQAVYEDHMGTDLRVVNAARVSFSSKSWYINDEYLPDTKSKRYSEWCQYRDSLLHANPHLRGGQHNIISMEDYGLINFLASHGHWTPFGHPQITLVMQAPVPIRTQCFKHKSGLVENEESRRYIKSVPSLFVPKEFRCAPANAKQGSAGVHPDSETWKSIYWHTCNRAILLYGAMIEDGVAPEQARFVLPQGVEVSWYWTGSLAAFARVYNQRTDSHAQGEIQDLAREMGALIKPLFPVSWAALTGDTQ